MIIVLIMIIVIYKYIYGVQHAVYLQEAYCDIVIIHISEPCKVVKSIKHISVKFYCSKNPHLPEVQHLIFFIQGLACSGSLFYYTNITGVT